MPQTQKVGGSDLFNKSEPFKIQIDPIFIVEGEIDAKEHR